MADPELIWLRPERGARGPAPAHSRAEIARVAVALADAEGLAGVSMRKVAGVLGTGAMSLYNYVPSKEQLFDLMLDAVAGEWELPQRPAGDARADLAEFARQGLAVLRRHPWVPTLVSTRLSIGPNSLRQLEYFLGILADQDIPGNIKMELFALTNSFLHQFAQFEANQAASASRTAADLGVFLGQAVATGAYPNLAGVFASAGGAPADLDPDSIFERTLPRLLTVILGPQSLGPGGTLPRVVRQRLGFGLQTAFQPRHRGDQWQPGHRVPAPDADAALGGDHADEEIRLASLDQWPVTLFVAAERDVVVPVGRG
jgi:AcrR family transcriptional regulator